MTKPIPMSQSFIQEARDTVHYDPVTGEFFFKKQCLNLSCRKENKLGITGVHLRPSGYQARITKDGQTMHLGTFKSLLDAA